jgi:hypothetical protein
MENEAMHGVWPFKMKSNGDSSGFPDGSADNTKLTPEEEDARRRAAEEEEEEEEEEEVF